MKKRDESPEHQKLIKDIQDNSIVAQVVQEVVASRIAVEIHEKQIAECYIKAKDAAIGMMIGDSIQPTL